MSIYHKVDVEGCEYAMNIINQYEHNIVSSTHTTGATDRYDMDWTLANGDKIIVEHKDRRIKYNTNEPQYTYTYDTIMFNVEKYEYLMGRYFNDDVYPIYMASYDDGLILYGLPRLPYNDIRSEINTVMDEYNKTGTMMETNWIKWKTITKTTVEKSDKSAQPRIMLPKPTDENNYGKILYKLNDE